MASLSDTMAGMNKIEELAEGTSAVHKLHPMVKLMATVIYIVVVISFNRYNVSGLIPFVFYPVVLMALADIPYSIMFKRVAMVLPFCAFAGISNIIFDTAPAFIIYGFVVTAGMVSFVSILLKSFLTVSAVLILVATTQMAELTYQLRMLKVPEILVVQLTMTYRYISVLLEETTTMYTAYILRSPNHKGVQMKDMGVFVGQLLLRSFDRAERVYCAMKCRGFEGGVGYTAYKRPRVSEIYLLVAVIIAMLALRFINLSLILGGMI